MWHVYRDSFGRVVGARTERIGDNICVLKNGRGWQDFLEWNAVQPIPLDLSDRPPEPPPIDTDLESIKMILEKQDDQISAAERWAIILKAMRRLVKKNAL